MAKLTQLSGPLAFTIKTLFPSNPEHMDLVMAFQDWEHGEIELSRFQIEKTLGAIRQYALPKTKALVQRQNHPELRQESELMLARWKVLEHLLENALKTA